MRGGVLRGAEQLRAGEEREQNLPVHQVHHAQLRAPALTEERAAVPINSNWTLGGGDRLLLPRTARPHQPEEPGAAGRRAGGDGERN